MFFICSSVETHLGSFQLLAMNNNDQMSLWYDEASFGCMRKIGMVGSRGVSIPIFMRFPSSWGLYTFAPPSAVDGYSLYLTALPALPVTCFIDLYYFDRCKMKCKCSFALMTKGFEHFFSSFFGDNYTVHYLKHSQIKTFWSYSSPSPSPSRSACHWYPLQKRNSNLKHQLPTKLRNQSHKIHI